MKTRSNSPPLAQPHPRNTPCARRLTRSTRAAISARYRLLVLRHEGRSLIRRSRFCTTCADSSAQHLFFAYPRRHTSYRRHPDGSLSPYDCTSHLAFKTGSKPTACAASSAQHALRAQARPQPNPRELHFSSLPIAPIHPRNTSSLRAATAARNCTSYRQPPAGAFRPSIFSRGTAWPCPLPLAPRKTHQPKTKQPLPSFSSHRTNVSESDSYPVERSAQFPSDYAASSGQDALRARAAPQLATSCVF